VSDSIPQPPQQPPQDDTTVHELEWWKWVLMVPLALVIRLWTASLRMRVDDASLPPRLLAYDGPMILLLWHNRLFAAGKVFRCVRRKRGRRLYGIVSASRDGALLTAFFKFVGIDAVRGSSSRRGMHAARAAVQKVREGHDLGITVDGPRGPAYQAKPGAAMLAIHANTPLLLIAPIYDNAWRAKSWDRFYIPKPFSTVRLNLRLLDSCAGLVDDPSDANRRDAVADGIERALRELSAGSDPEFGI